jgi:hypothetical protein
MEYTCPRCGRPVERFTDKNVHEAGLVGMFFSPFGSYVCKRCTWIKISEFPPDVRKDIYIKSVLRMIGWIILIIVGLYILSLLEPHDANRAR